MKKQIIFDNLINPYQVCRAFIMWLKARVGVSLLLLL